MKLQRSPIICPPMPNRSTKVFGGEASGILNWNDIKYPHFYELREEIRANFWIAAEVDMGGDADQFPLFQDEQTFLKRLGLLAQQNASQNDLSNEIADYATDPSVTSVFSTFYDQVMEHNHGITYVLSHIERDEQKQRNILASDDPIVHERLHEIEAMYEKLREQPTEENILKSLIHLAMMKGLQMYSTFAYFYQQTEKGQMKATSQMIGRIHRDRLAQLKFVGALFKVALQESEYEQDAIMEFAQALLEREVQREKQLSADQNMYPYIEYRADRVFKTLGLGTMYFTQSNPLPWIEQYIEIDSTEEKDQTSSSFDFYGFDDL